MKSKIIMIAIQIVLLGIAGGATWWFTKSSAPPVATEAGAAGTTAVAPATKPPVYFSIDPSFTVNLVDARGMRFLQVNVDVMSRDEEVISKVEAYLPRVRNDLIMLFTKLSKDDVNTEASRLKIQADALAVINKVLKDESGKAGVEAVYFSKFVMQ